MIAEKIVPLAKGVIKKLFIHRKFSDKTLGTDNGHYCFSVWLRHLIHSQKYGFNHVDKSIAELGPGDSLGIGIAALLTGCKSYAAMDVYKYWDIPRNLRIFDNLVELFKSRARIPDQSEFPKVFPELDDYSFPSHILTNDILEKYLHPDRVAMLRKELEHIDEGTNKHIRYFIPWNEKENVEQGSIDFIYSQAVLEYIDDLEKTFRKLNLWMKPGGMMSHCTDHSAHGFTKSWNAHWMFSQAEWKLVHGNNAIVLNRHPKSDYTALHQKHGFTILSCLDLKKPSRFTNKHFKGKYKQMSVEDASTFATYMISRKD